MDGLGPVVFILLFMSVALAIFFLAFRIFGRRTVMVASMAYDQASRFGSVGKAVYFGCWILLFPIMLGICVVGGIVIWLGEQAPGRG